MRVSPFRWLIRRALLHEGAAQQHKFEWLMRNPLSL